MEEEDVGSADVGGEAAAALATLAVSEGLTPAATALQAPSLISLSLEDVGSDALQLVFARAQAEAGVRLAACSRKLHSEAKRQALWDHVLHHGAWYMPGPLLHTKSMIMCIFLL